MTGNVGMKATDQYEKGKLLRLCFLGKRGEVDGDGVGMKVQ